MKPVTLDQLGRKRNPTSIYIRICFLDSNMPRIHPHPWGLFSCWQPHRRQQGTNRKSMPCSLLFQTSRKWSHASICWEAESFFPATEASMFHVKHPPTTRKTKTQNTTPTHNKNNQRFTWNNWIVVETSCFTWNIEKLSTTRKHDCRRKRFPLQSITHVSHETLTPW